MTGLFWRWDRETGIVSPTDVHGYMEEMAKYRIVRLSQVGCEVSTVFLSLNFNPMPDSPPLVFETRVTGGPLDGEHERYTTFAQAKAGHEAMVDRVTEAARLVRQFKEDAMKPNTGGNVIPPATPVHGIALRDFFAAHALTGLIASDETNGDSYADITKSAYDAADAMLNQREKKA